MTNEPLSTRPTTDTFPIVWQRMVALSGVVFAVLLLISFFVGGGETPNYTDSDGEWREWAADNETRAQLALLLVLIASAEALFFAGGIRTALGAAETAARGFARIARIVFAGAIVGIVGLVLGDALIVAAASHGDDVDVSAARAVLDAASASFLLLSVGFGVMLIAAGLVTMRTGAYPRWTAVVAFVGGVAFLITFLAALQLDDPDGPFGIGYPIGFLALIVWSIATSIENYRRVGRPPAAMAAPADPVR